MDKWHRNKFCTAVFSYHSIHLFFTKRKSAIFGILCKGSIHIINRSMVWGYTQIVFDAIGQDLNTIVFRDVFHMMGEYATQYQFGRLKVSGLCWNAGNFAPLITFGYIYTKNSYLKVAFFMLGFLSGSRTLMMGLLVSAAIELVVTGKFKTTVSKKKVVFLAVAVTVIVIAFVTNIDSILKKVVEITDLLDIKNRVRTEGSANTHLYY